VGRVAGAAPPSPGGFFSTAWAPHEEEGRVKDLPLEPTRLAASEQGDAGGIEALASALVRNLPVPPPPRPADLARIRERVRSAAMRDLPARRAWASGVFLV